MDPKECLSESLALANKRRMKMKNKKFGHHKKMGRKGNMKKNEA